MASEQIVFDVVDNGADGVKGKNLADLRIIGQLPSAVELDDNYAALIVRTVGGMTIISRSATDEVLVEVRGFSKAMEAMASMFELPVQVSADHGVSGGKVASVVGKYGEQFAQTTAVVEMTEDIDETGLVEMEAVPVSKPIDGGDVEAARKQIQDTGRVFLAECANFAPKAAFDVLVESGTHELIMDGDMSRYVRKGAIKSQREMEERHAELRDEFSPNVYVKALPLGNGVVEVTRPNGQTDIVAYSTYRRMRQIGPEVPAVKAGDVFYRDRDGMCGEVVRPHEPNGTVIILWKNGTTGEHDVWGLLTEGLELIPAERIHRGFQAERVWSAEQIAARAAAEVPARAAFLASQVIGSPAVPRLAPRFRALMGRRERRIARRAAREAARQGARAGVR